jgi:ubiquinone/menaquinone biosynthesis C-methylase UbiE/DNA-binding HxlR family transcriptional regulator
MAEVLKYLRTLADPTRLRILCLLEKEVLSVRELQAITRMGQSRISTHLGVLQESELVYSHRKGRSIFYKLSPLEELSHSSLIRSALEGARQLPDYSSDQANLKRVLALRKERSRLFFNQVAGRFDLKYGPGRSWQAFGQLLLKMLPPLVIADLGSGEGLMSELFTQSAKQVIAVDSSPEIIRFGENQAKKAKIKNIEFRLGDIQEPPIAPASVDVAILSQVLHHLEKPELAISAAIRILVPGGKIFILDLLKHHFSEAHEVYGDTRLGFSEGEIHLLLEQAGFENIDISIASREENPPYFQTLLATAIKRRDS